MSVFCNSLTLRSSYCETSPALSCFSKSIFRVFEGGCLYLLLMVDFEKIKKTPGLFCCFCGQPAAFPAFPASLVFSLFGQFCVSESLEIRRHARKFDDAPLNVVFGEPVSPNRGPRHEFPCQLFLLLPKIWKTREKTVFLREMLGSTGETQGSTRERGEEIESRHDRKAMGNERETKGN